MKKIISAFIMTVCMLFIMAACGDVQVGAVMEEYETYSNMTGVVSDVVEFSVQPTYEHYEYDRRNATAEATFADVEVVSITFPNEEWVKNIEVSKNTQITIEDDKIIFTFEGFDKYNVKLPENTIKTELNDPIDVIKITLYDAKHTRG